MTSFDLELRARVGHLFIEAIALETQRDSALQTVAAQAAEIKKLQDDLRALQAAATTGAAPETS